MRDTSCWMRSGVTSMKRTTRTYTSCPPSTSGWTEATVADPRAPSRVYASAGSGAVFTRTARVERNGAAPSTPDPVARQSERDLGAHDHGAIAGQTEVLDRTRRVAG